METITFNCEVITPMFLAGADGKTPELRPPSIKGAMRFWWRAMNGDLSIAELREREAVIFGGSGKNQDGADHGKSAFYIRKISHNLQKQSLDTSTYQYITYGLDNRQYFAPGSFSIQIDIVKLNINFQYNAQGETLGTDINTKTEILQSMYYLSMFGGLGSKSRNGLGSFKITNATIYNQDTWTPNTWEINYNKTVLPNNDKNCLYNYKTFIQKSLCYRFQETFTSYAQALEHINTKYKDSKNQKNSNGTQSTSIYKNKLHIAAPDLYEHPRHPKACFFRVGKEANKSNSYYVYYIYLPSTIFEHNENQQNDYLHDYKLFNSNIRGLACNEQ